MNLQILQKWKIGKVGWMNLSPYKLLKLKENSRNGELFPNLSPPLPACKLLKCKGNVESLEYFTTLYINKRGASPQVRKGFFRKSAIRVKYLILKGKRGENEGKIGVYANGPNSLILKENRGFPACLCVYVYVCC